MEATIFPEAVAADYDLEAQVREALLGLDELRATAAEISIRCRQGHVTLSGFVPSAMAATEAERATLAVPGVVSVADELLDDGTLVRRIAATLAENPLTSAIAPGYQVVSRLGQVAIVGRFTPTQADALATVARTEAGVRGVQVKNL